MDLYRAAYPICEYTQHAKWKVQVHHWLPVKHYPQYAASLWNFYSLAGTGAIHLAVGHNGNYKTIAYDLPELILKRRGPAWLEARQDFLKFHNSIMPQELLNHA